MLQSSTILPELPDFMSSDGFAGLRRRLFLFQSRDVKRGDCNAASVVEPDDNTRTVWIDSGMLRSWHPILFACARNNREGLKRAHAQKLSNVAYHCARILT